MIDALWAVLAFKLPSTDALIGVALLVLVLGVCFIIARRIIPKDDSYALILNVIAGIIAIVLLLVTFTTWSGGF